MARGQHPNSRANLKRVPKGGPSPNPSGRQPDLLTQVLRRLVDDKEAEVLVEALLAECRAGNIKALSLVFDRLEGRVPQPLDIQAEVTTVQKIVEVEVATPVELIS